MKKLFVVLGLLLIATMLFVGCGKTDNSAPTTTYNQLQPQNFDKTATLFGKIMDAVTGAPIGNDNNSDLKVWLIQGTDNRGTSKLITDKNDPNCGEYAFDGVPVSFDFNDNSVVKVVVVKSGYQRFEAEVYMGYSYSNPGNVTIIDNVISMIGNIYLYPLGETAGDVRVTVKDPIGTPVPNAMVLLQQDVTNNNTIARTGDRLSPSAGLYTSLSGTTNASGVVTFSGANLVLGGAYIAIAEGMAFGGEQLATKTGTMFRVGVDSQDQSLAMSATPGALYATSASNSVPGTVTSTGVLTITFNQPIFLTTTTFAAVATNGTISTPNATGALTNGGLTLTITPSFLTAPSTTFNAATVTYTYGGTIYLNSPRVPSGVTFDGAGTTLKDVFGVAVSRAVQMTAVQ